MEHIKLIPKRESIKKFIDYSISAFVDSSGSTEGVRLRTEVNIVRNLVKSDRIVYWNTDAILTTNPRSDGGTDPSCIFSKSTTENLFKNSEIILFLTDGEIGQHEVTKFSNNINKYLNKALYVCIIVGSLYVYNLRNLNVSVIASIMMAPNVLCLYANVDNHKTYIISSKGNVSQMFLGKDFQEFDLGQLNQISISSQNLPSGHMVLSETNDSYKVIDIDKALGSNTVLNLTEEEWHTIIKYGALKNDLETVRTLINHSRNYEIQEIKKVSKDKFEFKYMKQRDDIINRMIDAFNSHDTNSQLKFKEELSSINELAREEEIKWNNYLTEHVSVARKKWDAIRTILAGFDKEKFSLNNFTFGSNRAMRAKEITDKEDDEFDVIKNLTHINVPEIQCSIHLDNGPAVLWVNKFDDLTYSTSDHCVTFPLSHYPKMSKCIVNNPVCGMCASSYIKYTKQSVYRDPLYTYIPLDWSNYINMKYANKAILKSFCGGKMLHYAKMLLLSIVDDHNEKWFDENVKNYFVKRMVDNIVTNDTLSEEGKRDKLKNVLSVIIKNEPDFLRQPFPASMRILKFAHLYSDVSKEIIFPILQKRFAYLMCELYSKYTISCPNSQINEQLKCILFENVCNIPIKGKIKDVNVNDLKQFINDPVSLDFLNKLTTLLNINTDTLINTKIIKNILYHLTKLDVHERPLTILTKLNNSKIFANIGMEPENINDIITNNMFRRYKVPVNDNVPEYAFYNGSSSTPSKLWFYNEPLWDSSIENTMVPLDKLVTMVHERLQKKLISNCGSYYPNNSSSHIMLHRIVADVLENKFKDTNEFEDRMVLECMDVLRKTEGNYGNIYTETVFDEVILTIYDFCNLRKTSINYRTGDTNIDRSVKHKVRSELESNGLKMIVDKGEECVLFDPKLLRQPKLMKDKYTIDIPSIMSRISNNNKIQTQTIIDKPIEIHLVDDDAIGINSSIDNVTKFWDDEQEEIRKKIKLERMTREIKYIGGMDISFAEGTNDAVGCLVIHEYSTSKLMMTCSIKCKMQIPYKAGYLAFREAPVYLKLLDCVTSNYPELKPDVILMDGNGIWHPRSCGIATHFATLTGIPCIGVCKEVLFVDGVGRDNVREKMKTSAKDKGMHVEIFTDKNNMLGYAYNSSGSTKKAIYISPGNYVSFEQSLEIVKNVTKYKISETIRQADKLSRLLVA